MQFTEQPAAVLAEIVDVIGEFPFALRLGIDESGESGGCLGVRLDGGDAVELAEFAADPAASEAGNVHPNAAGALGSGLEFIGGTVGDDATLVDDDGASAGRFHFLEDVGGENDDLVRPETFDELADLVFLIGIQAVGGFVENEDFRIVQEDWARQVRWR